MRILKKPTCFICNEEDYNLYLVGVCKECKDTRKGMVTNIKSFDKRKKERTFIIMKKPKKDMLVKEARK